MAKKKPEPEKPAEKVPETEPLKITELEEGKGEQEETEDSTIALSADDGKTKAKTLKHVKVVAGINSIEMPLVGKTVAEIREALAQPLNIDPEAVAMIDGEEVDEDEADVSIEEGQQLEFVKQAGAKG